MALFAFQKHNFGRKGSPNIKKFAELYCKKMQMSVSVLWNFPRENTTGHNQSRSICASVKSALITEPR